MENIHLRTLGILPANISYHFTIDKNMPESTKELSIIKLYISEQITELEMTDSDNEFLQLEFDIADDHSDLETSVDKSAPYCVNF